jgi:hypothetical protein
VATDTLRIEIRLAGARIADHHARGFTSDRWRRALPSDRLHHTAHIHGDRQRIVTLHGNRRHASARAAAQNYRHNHLAFFVGERDLAAQQVRTAHVAATEIRSVASAATDAVQRFAALDLRGVGRRPRLAGNKSPLSFGTAPAAACGTLRRLLLSIHTRSYNQGKCEKAHAGTLTDFHGLLKAPNYALYAPGARKRWHRCLRHVIIARCNKTGGKNPAIFSRAHNRRWPAA